MFPEPFALLATAWAVRLSVPGTGSPPSLHHLLWFTTALGLLPWFHRKYAVYGFLLLVAVAWRQRGRLVPERGVGWLGVLACFLAPQAALMGWTWYYWGTFGGPLMLERAPFSADALRIGSLGLLVDRENGLFVWAPIYLLLPAAWLLARKPGAVWLAPIAALFLMSAAHDQWWGGFSPAARFLVPLVPVFALAAVGIVKDRVLRWLSVLLLLPQILISAYGWQYPRTLWPQGDGENRVVGAMLRRVGLADGFLPSLRSPQPEMARAMVAVTAVAAVNAVALAVASRRRRLAGIRLSNRHRSGLGNG
jgi:hypothetical protein